MTSKKKKSITISVLPLKLNDFKDECRMGIVRREDASYLVVAKERKKLFREKVMDIKHIKVNEKLYFIWNENSYIFVKLSNKKKEEFLKQLLLKNLKPLTSKNSLQQVETNEKRLDNFIPQAPPLASSIIPKAPPVNLDDLTGPAHKISKEVNNEQKKENLTQAFANAIEGFELTKLKKVDSEKAHKPPAFDPARDIVGFDKGKLKKVILQVRSRDQWNGSKLAGVMVTMDNGEVEIEGRSDRAKFYKAESGDTGSQTSLVDLATIPERRNSLCPPPFPGYKPRASFQLDQPIVMDDTKLKDKRKKSTSSVKSISFEENSEPTCSCLGSRKRKSTKVEPA
ncbi:DgyrCDS1086 [Dimorphilus gyrociliatus]|uniref:DgyrCDS1086 n=1 Tax=Dimorphilus gyrociliatus TaxID=2664684 RepID=A0A7I8V6J0_9ANNE|nr:DgyrCDS1086 [Dimorphilus gyrociliatus]